MQNGMITLIAKVKAKPGREAVVREALLALIKPTREEDGCIVFDLYNIVDEKGTFVLYEKWKTKNDLDTHMKTPHVMNYLAATKDSVQVWESNILVPLSVT